MRAQEVQESRITRYCFVRNAMFLCQSRKLILESLQGLNGVGDVLIVGYRCLLRYQIRRPQSYLELSWHEERSERRPIRVPDLGLAISRRHTST